MNLEFKVEDGKLYSRERPKELRKNAGECPFCGEPVYVAGGQLLKYFRGSPTHKKCRK